MTRLKIREPITGTKAQARRDWLALCGIQATFWSVCTMQSSFLVSFLTRNGYSDTLTANIVFFMSIVNLAAQPMWGFIADAKWSLKRVILCCLGVSIPILILIPSAAASVVFTVVLNLMYGFFNQPLQGLTDAITSITATQNRYVVYGVTRGCGSLCAALSSLFIGKLLDVTGLDALFYINAGLCGIAFVLMLTFRGVSYGRDCAQSARLARENITIPYAASVLIKNRKYVYLVLSTILLNTGNRLAHLYVPIMINKFGGTSAHLGTALFLNCILMAPCMVAHSWMIRRGITNHIPYIISGLFAAARIFTMGVTSTLSSFVTIQILQSFAYGLMQPATIQAISEVSPLKLRSTAISLAVAVQIVLSTFIGNNLGSRLVGLWGERTTFFCYAMLTVVGLIIYLPVLRHDDRVTQES
ncbi:MAG: MFS transporter [Clostridia bacterium]